MQPRPFINLLTALVASGLGISLIIVGLLTWHIEEPWNIVVIAEVLQLLKYVLFFSMASAIGAGLPVVAFLQWKKWLGILPCILAGTLAGALPGLLFGLNTSFDSSINDQPLGIDGVPTLAGWIEFAKPIVLTSSCGMVGGFIFWAVMRLMRGASVPIVAQDKSQFRYWSVVSATAAIAVGLFALPGIFRDNSCHNLFRDGRTSIAPRMSADITLVEGDWTAIADLTGQFASANNLSIRQDRKISGGELSWQTISLCNNDGFVMTISDRPVLAAMRERASAQHPNLVTKVPRTELSIFEIKDGSNWRTMAHALLTKLQPRLPERITFRVSGSYSAVSLDDALK